MSASTVPDLPGDSELVEAYLEGDEGSAAELVRRHSSAVGRFLYSSGAIADDVDDLVQESLFRAFRGIGGWRRTASFRSWLFTIAGNLLRDEFRRRKGRRVIALEGRDVPDRPIPMASWPRRRRRSGCARAWRACLGCSARSFSCGRRRERATTKSPPRWAPRRARLGFTTITRSSD